MSTDTNLPPHLAMSAASRNMLVKVRKLVPPLLESFHKGQLGRVATIGGSVDYTGAPYYSAMASARLGCDLSYLFCEPSAASVIKTYSPALMVSPVLRSSSTLQTGFSKDKHDLSGEDLAKPITDMFGRLHVLVIGPGLGRDEVTQKQIKAVIKAARAHDPPLPMVLDADALWLIQNEPDLIKGYKDCILTPNVVEFGRLAKAMGMEDSNEDQAKRCQELAKRLGGICILQKGPHDYISQGDDITVSDFKGGLKRSGGQGDTLTGCLGTFLAWRQIYHEGLWDVGKDPMSREETLIVAAFGGSAITRECSRRAFEKHARSLLATDLTEQVHDSFMSLVGEPEYQVDKEKTNARI